MDKLKTLEVPDRKDWRAWLEANFDQEKEIWLVYPNKSSGKSRILYNDAVEEALCFGWIDSTIRSINQDSSAQRFSPRNPKSTYSQANKEYVSLTSMGHEIVRTNFKKGSRILSGKQKTISRSDLAGLINIIDQVSKTDDKTGKTLMREGFLRSRALFRERSQGVFGYDRDRQPRCRRHFVIYFNFPLIHAGKRRQSKTANTLTILPLTR